MNVFKIFVRHLGQKIQLRTNRARDEFLLRKKERPPKKQWTLHSLTIDLVNYLHIVVIHLLTLSYSRVHRLMSQ